MAPEETLKISERALAARGKDYLSILNDKQREAVKNIEGPLLVLAGAGTGKTRALTARVSHILNMQAARPDEILAVTFTNKAAREMKKRIENIKVQQQKSLAPRMGYLLYLKNYFC